MMMFDFKNFHRSLTTVVRAQNDCQWHLWNSKYHWKSDTT